MKIRGGVDRVGDLRRGAPALGRALLEQPQRVPVAVVDVVQGGLLHRGGERDEPGPRRGAHAAGHPDDGRRVLPLLVAQIGGGGPGPAAGQRAGRPARRCRTGRTAATPPPPPMVNATKVIAEEHQHQRRRRSRRTAAGAAAGAARGSGGHADHAGVTSGRSRRPASPSRCPPPAPAAWGRRCAPGPAPSAAETRTGFGLPITRPAGMFARVDGGQHPEVLVGGGAAQAVQPLPGAGAGGRPDPGPGPPAGHLQRGRRGLGQRQGGGLQRAAPVAARWRSARPGPRRSARGRRPRAGPTGRAGHRADRVAGPPASASTASTR